jgi:hypothetical protein
MLLFRELLGYKDVCRLADDDQGAYAVCGKDITDRMEAEDEDVIYLYIMLCLCVDRARYVMLDLLTGWDLDIFVITK